MTRMKALLLFFVVAPALTVFGFFYKSSSDHLTRLNLMEGNQRNAQVMRQRATDCDAARYVFIDAGARYGKAIRQFKRNGFYEEHPWEIVAFEANPYICHRVPADEDVVLFNQAVWNEDGMLDFYLAKSTASSTVKKNKRTGGVSKTPISVQSVDLGRFIRENFSPDDQIILKMDIEGAEYEVLENMLADGSIEYLNRLYVEFHNAKIDVDRSADERLMAQIRDLGIPVEEEEVYHHYKNWFQHAM